MNKMNINDLTAEELEKLEERCKNCKQPYFYHAKYKTYALCNIDGNTPNTKFLFYEPMPANPTNTTSKDDEAKKPSYDNMLNAVEANVMEGWTAKNIFWLATSTVCFLQELADYIIHQTNNNQSKIK